MVDLANKSEAIADSLQEAIRFWSINRRRSAVRLWDILWQLADISQPACSSAVPVPAAIQNAVAFIDSHLHEPINIQQLARDQGMSHNHFTRLFRASQNQSPMEYVQSRRAAQAKHLLIYSSLPLKAIAASIAIEDPQIFNKFIKHRFGLSPKKFRDQEQPKIGLWV